jgi:GNAT superfamily N-acetyltransferase
MRVVPTPLLPVPVRRAAPADADLVGRMLDAFNREYDTETPGPAVLAQRLRRLLADGDVVALLAAEPAIGLAVLTLRPNVWFDGPVGLLDELYVVPSVRGQGTGAELLRAAEDVVRERGGELLEVNVDDDGEGARRFYERHGYRNTEVGSEDAQLYLWRDLSRRRS